MSGPVEALYRKGVPRSVSAVVILAVVISLLGAAVMSLWTPAQSWLNAAPHTATTIQRKLGPATRVLQRITVISDRAGHLADTPGGAAAKPQTVVAPAADSETVLAVTRTVVVGLVTVVILTLFLLAAGAPVLARMSATFASNTHAAQVLLVMRAVRREVGRYYATIAAINLGFGLCVAGAMWALGMPDPLLCGAVAALLNFIPYIGSATTFFVLTVVAFVSLDSLPHVLAVAGSYLALAMVEGQIIQPLLVGRRLELNPVIVFLALWFGGWFWGIAGIILAIPTLVAIKVAAEHNARGRSLVEFLSPGSKKSLARKTASQRSRKVAAET